MKPGNLEVEVKLAGFERLERIAEMVDKIKVLEELGPNDRIVLSVAEPLTLDQYQGLKETVAVTLGLNDMGRILILSGGVEIEAIFRAHEMMTEEEYRARAREDFS